MSDRAYHMSASSIAAYKACPTRWRLGYLEGIRPADDTESQRVGTNWHALHEVYADTFNERFRQYTTHGPEDEAACTEECCDFALAEVVNHLNERYTNCPLSIDPLDWAVERQILWSSFIAYQWHWHNDPLKFLASEVPFKLPLYAPKTGMPLPADEVLRVGKIDHIVKWQGAICALERKSTSRSIDPSSDYWDKSRKDTQVSMYALAFRDMKLSEVLLPLPLAHTDGVRFGNTLYDVWKRPTIKPAMLTQKDTAAFMESGEYYGQKFTITPGAKWTINGQMPEIELGKKGRAFAIRETIEMYGARLLHDMTERPDFYFQRKEIVRTDAEIQEFRKQLFAVYQGQRLMEKHGTFYENEQQCRATFACQYIPICYGPGSEAVCDSKTVPQGFKRIFVDLTREGKALEE